MRLFFTIVVIASFFVSWRLSVAHVFAAEDIFALQDSAQAHKAHIGIFLSSPVRPPIHSSGTSRLFLHLYMFERGEHEEMTALSFCAVSILVRSPSVLFEPIIIPRLLQVHSKFLTLGLIAPTSVYWVCFNVIWRASGG